MCNVPAVRHVCGQVTVTPPPSPRQPGEATIPDLSELRAQWRHLETMVRDETESARTRSDVILRLSGISESSQ